MPKPPKPTQIISGVPAYFYLLEMLQKCNTIHKHILKVKWLQSRQSSFVQRAHCETELRNFIHPLTQMTQPLMIYVTCFSVSHLSVFIFAPFLKHTTPCVRSQIHPCGTHSRCLYHCHSSPPGDRGSRCLLWCCAWEARRDACLGCCSDQGSSLLP